MPLIWSYKYKSNVHLFSCLLERQTFYLIISLKISNNINRTLNNSKVFTQSVFRQTTLELLIIWCILLENVRQIA